MKHEQLELFPIKTEEVQSWIQTKALKTIDDTHGKTIERVYCHLPHFNDEGGYMFMRFTDESFIIIDDLMTAMSIMLLVTENENILDTFGKFFTMLEMNYIRELRLDPAKFLVKS